jgi:hypothetical protein
MRVDTGRGSFYALKDSQKYFNFKCMLYVNDDDAIGLWAFCNFFEVIAS